MISYETYKMLHLFFILTFFASLGFVASSSELVQNKSGKIVVGVFSFLIFVAGMGLIARLGFKHSEPFPLWIRLKILNWVMINALLVAVFKLKSLKAKAGIAALILFLGWAGVWVALNKPV